MTSSTVDETLISAPSFFSFLSLVHPYNNMDCTYCGETRQEFLCVGCVTRKVRKKQALLHTDTKDLAELEKQQTQQLLPLANEELLRMRLRRSQIITQRLDVVTAKKMKQIQDVLKQICELVR